MKQELINNLKQDIVLLLEKHSKEIAKDNIGQAFNIMKDVDITLCQLKTLTGINDDFETPKKTIHKGWYDVLKFFIDTKQPQLIKLDHSSRENEMKHRATGKTSAIVRLSNDYKIPIYTSKIHSSDLKAREKELNLNAVIVDDIRLLNMQQYSIKGIVLVDELTDISKIDIDKFIIIGFTH
jgi:hypothetical protein